MTRCLIVSSLVMMSATVASAQTLPYPIPSTAKVQWDHEGPTQTAPLDKFTLQVDTAAAVDLVGLVPINGPHGTKCGKDPLPLCTYETPFPAVTPGRHTLALRACNTVGCSTPAMLDMTVAVLPANPSQLRIIITPGE